MTMLLWMIDYTRKYKIRKKIWVICNIKYRKISSEMVLVCIEMTCTSSKALKNSKLEGIGYSNIER